MSTKTQRALVVLENGSVGVVDTKPYPVIGSNEIIVNVKAVALNPTDWKHIDRSLKPGNSTGSDFAGVVVEAGSEAESNGIKVGDSVAGFVRGGFDDPNNGAFQEFIKIRSDLVWKKPDSVSYDEAAAMGIAFLTAAWALYWYVGLPKPWEAPKTEEKTPLLIWAGSTSVGLNAIALAKLAGYPVISTASPRNHELLKSIGAEAAFDYRDSNVVSKIKDWGKTEATKEGIRLAFDTNSTKESIQLTAQSLGSEGGKVVTLLTTDPEEKYPEGVEIKYILLYHVLYTKNAKETSEINELYQNLPELAARKVVGNAVPLKVSDGGLEAIPEGLDLLRKGEVSATKFVYRL